MDISKARQGVPIVRDDLASVSVSPKMAGALVSFIVITRDCQTEIVESGVDMDTMICHHHNVNVGGHDDVVVEFKAVAILVFLEKFERAQAVL